MFSTIDYSLSKHDETVLRAEAKYAVMAALRSARSNQPDAAPRRVWAVLRRIARTAAAA